MSSQCWKVVGGGDKGGILAKVGKDAASDKLDKLLATNAIVQELEISGQKLRYKLISGDGPPTGWVSLKIQSKALLIQDDTVIEPEKEEEIPEGAPELVYFDVPSGLGELTRLVLRAGGVAFKDTRLPLGFTDIAVLKELIVRGDAELSEEECQVLEETFKANAVNAMLQVIPSFFHGKVKLTQSGAIAQYAADIGIYAEKARTPEQRALDGMILGLRTDLQKEMFPISPNGGMPEKVRRSLQKGLFAKIEHQLQGLERAYSRKPGPFLYTSEAEGPSLADIVVFNLVTSPSPGLIACEVDMSMFPKTMASVEAVRKSEVYPGLKSYIEKMES